MKPILLLCLLIALAMPYLRADDAPGSAPSSGDLPHEPNGNPPDAPATPPAPVANEATANAPTSSIVPAATFPPERYEILWKKSPFSVATPEGTADTSPDYSLVGIANIEGITYASLIERQNNEHFLISSDKPVRGLTLNAITRGPNGGDTYANVMKDGQTITLKLEAPSAASPGTTPIPGIAVPGSTGTIIPNITAPGSGQPPPGGSVRPFPRIHRPRITLPPAPAPAPPPAPSQPAPPPTPPPG